MFRKEDVRKVVVYQSAAAAVQFAVRHTATANAKQNVQNVHSSSEITLKA